MTERLKNSKRTDSPLSSEALTESDERTIANVETFGCKVIQIKSSSRPRMVLYAGYSRYLRQTRIDNGGAA